MNCNEKIDKQNKAKVISLLVNFTILIKIIVKLSNQSSE